MRLWDILLYSFREGALESNFVDIFNCKVTNNLTAHKWAILETVLVSDHQEVAHLLRNRNVECRVHEVR
jgi:hypothetical protein